MSNPWRAREDEQSPNGRQVLVLIFGGFCVALGGWAGFGITVGASNLVFQALAFALGAMFFLGALALIVGLGLALFLFFRFLFSGSRE